MKLKSSSKHDRLYLVARFEQFLICDFSVGASGAVHCGAYAARLSAADSGNNRFYVYVSKSGVASVYRDGVNCGTLCQSDYESADHDSLNTMFPLKAHVYDDAQLERGFDLVKPKTHWKDPINAVIREEDRDVVSAAIMHYTATKATFYPAAALGSGKWLAVRADGYRLGPAN